MFSSSIHKIWNCPDGSLCSSDFVHVATDFRFH